VGASQVERKNLSDGLIAAIAMRNRNEEEQDLKRSGKTMSSIWSSQAEQAGSSPFQTNGRSPLPGGMTTARIQSAGKPSGHAATQPGMSPGARGGPSALAATTSSGTSSGSDSGTTISSNDFLSLLVTEMQNQDPTANTDPNEYVNQLVQINSLEQLISMNQSLSAVLGAASPTGVPQPSVVAGAVGVAGKNASAPGAIGPSAGLAHRASGRAIAKGNLASPAGKPAAAVVAHALDGRSRRVGMGHGIRDIPTH
jgi:flagellar basal-body rod modification protein FlgD